MKIVPLADAKAKLSAYIDVCRTEGPIIITRSGKPVAVLLAPTDEDDLDRLMPARSPRFQALLEKSRRSIAAGKGLSRDEFWEAFRHRRCRGNLKLSIGLLGVVEFAYGNDNPYLGHGNSR